MYFIGINGNQFDFICLRSVHYIYSLGQIHSLVYRTGFVYPSELRSSTDETYTWETTDLKRKSYLRLQSIKNILSGNENS